MALHIEDPEVERLARMLSEQRGVPVEEAVRGLLLDAVKPRSQIIQEWFETRMRHRIPPDQLGRTLTKEEEEEILGMDY